MKILRAIKSAFREWVLIPLIAAIVINAIVIIGELLGIDGIYTAGFLLLAIIIFAVIIEYKSIK